MSDGGRLYRWKNSDRRIYTIASPTAERYLSEATECVGTLADYLGLGTGQLQAGSYYTDDLPLTWVEPHHFEGRFARYEDCEHCMLPQTSSIHLERNGRR